MHRRGFLLVAALMGVTAGCSQPRRPDPAASPHLGRVSAGDPSLPAGSYGEHLAHQGVAMIGAGQFDERAVLIESIARSLTTDSLKPDSVAAKCRRSA